MPFVTWEIQDKHILEIERAINVGYDMLTDKSRDMGATWDHLVVLHHQWLFKQDRNFLIISRKEDAVDTYGKGGETGSDPGTLFGKHDYINRWLPIWMLPLYDRKRLHLVNMVTKSRIDGESANATAGSSDRRTAILLDEMAKMEEGEAIKRSTRDVTACRLANSTPNGAGTAFSKWRQSGTVKVFPLMFWDHPEKGRGRYVIQNEATGKWEIRSPWFDAEAKIRSPKELAIEILADHIGSGDTFFEASNIEVHRHLFARPPKLRLSLDFRLGISTEMIPAIIGRKQLHYIEHRRDIKGPLRLWKNLINGRLDQTKSYVSAWDISKGQGASNSVGSIVCVEDREKIGEWVDANTPPYELARIACAVALWVGGATPHRMIWEAPGPGWDFGRQVVKVYAYPYFFVDHSSGTIVDNKGIRYGWHPTRDKKHEVLGILRRAYAHGGFINHSDEALNEALTYVHYEDGGLGPAELIKESEDARKTHGDRVIADMLSLLLIEESPLGKHKEPVAPKTSIAARMKRWRDRKKAGKSKHRFDFTFTET